MAVDYAFTELGMQRLETSVFKNNKQAMRIDKFLGYKELPGSEEVFVKNGREEIAVRMFMTRTDWESCKQALII